MSEKSAIEWTDATWNPVTGCTKITRGCDNCYAERFAERFRGTRGHPFERGFDLTLRPERISQPLSWKQPKMIFVNSMSDLFHKEIPTEFVNQVFETMEEADWHIFQVLTKRSSNMRNYLKSRYGSGSVPRHIWCGVSVEDDTTTARVRHLQQAPIATRFLSIEPMLGPVSNIDLDGISWVIAGGESGAGSRPIQFDWVLEIRNLCKRAGVPFFFKQWGGLTPKANGRLINGVEYSTLPAYLKGERFMPKKPKSFLWTPGDDPPEIEEHSEAKLTVLRSYLRAYFDRLGAYMGREDFKLDLVDGFSGGGEFRKDGKTISGTPLIMLEEAVAAEIRLSKNRTKPLKFNIKHYFIDVNPKHTDYLRKVLGERNYDVNSPNIVIQNKKFEESVDKIIASIKSRQPRSGRSIFLLDQCGYSDVNLMTVKKIFEELNSAEVILTFAEDALIRFLSAKRGMIKYYAPLSMSKAKIDELLQLKSEEHGRALAQRVLRGHIRFITGAEYDTPFFLRPKGSRRTLWFLHLSRHPIARDVMIQCHWNVSNHFEHYGPGGLQILGWEGLTRKTTPLFRFGGLDKKEMDEQLLNELPAKLYILASEGPVTRDAILHTLANDTAARSSDIDQILAELNREKAIQIIAPDGKVRSKSLKNLRSTDRIKIPSQPILPGIRSRR